MIRLNVSDLSLDTVLWRDLKQPSSRECVLDISLFFNEFKGLMPEQFVDGLYGSLHMILSGEVEGITWPVSCPLTFFATLIHTRGFYKPLNNFLISPNNNSLSNPDKGLIVYESKLLANYLSSQTPISVPAYHGIEDQMLPLLREIQFPLSDRSVRLIGKTVFLPFFASTSTSGWITSFGDVGDRYSVLKFDDSVDKFSIEKVTGNGESEALVTPGNVVVRSISTGPVSNPVFSKYLCSPNRVTTLSPCNPQVACSQEVAFVIPVFNTSVGTDLIELSGYFQNNSNCLVPRYGASLYLRMLRS